MSYKAAKISFDGSHYIATPKENFPQGHKRRRKTRPLSVEETEKKAQFEAAYKESSIRIALDFLDIGKSEFHFVSSL